MCPCCSASAACSSGTQRPAVRRRTAFAPTVLPSATISNRVPTRNPRRRFNATTEKGARRVHLIAQEHAENVTVVACVNAIGTAVPPMVIFKGKRMRPEFYDNLPAGCLVKMAPKGSMTTELFIQFIQHLANNKSPGKCLLILNGAASHLDYQIADEAEKFDIELYCLPSNTTLELQPLDKSATGLYPWDPSAIPDAAYAPSLLTETSNQLQQIPGQIQSPSRTLSPIHTQNFDSDDTHYDDMSPSFLHTSIPERQQSTSKKLVDYSSSSESFVPIDEIENVENLNFGNRTPVPSTSKENHSYFPISSPSENGSDTFIYKMIQHNPVRQYKIYTSSSESEEENVPRSTCDQNCPAEAATHDSDDSEDNIPLLKSYKAIPADVPKTPFQELIPTPNIATIKTKPRRKALNYVGQRVTKDLFTDVQVKRRFTKKIYI
ncbi:hypothetical protein ABMA27_009136 [Loxostege sticticalis]|uniref:DDE-1 domain-containing protein n=1 Tax=Loxostege sticticalis TaxID=481309 RepID=A0ABR3HA14_LOXSC